MLYFLISFILFFTSAQSSDIIEAYYSAFTGEFPDTPKAISFLARRLSLGLRYDSEFYKNIPQKLIELGFSLPENIASFENLISEILELANSCYHMEITSSSVSQNDLFIKKRHEFYEKLNIFYNSLRDYFVENPSAFGIEIDPEISELNQVFMTYLIDADLNLFTPHQIAFFNSHEFDPTNYEPKLNWQYVRLLLQLKDTKTTTASILSLLTPYLSQNEKDIVFADLIKIFRFRDFFLEFPSNKYGLLLVECIKEHSHNLFNMLKNKSILNDTEIEKLVNEYLKTFF